jgi:hypothetical protein
LQALHRDDYVDPAQHPEPTVDDVVGAFARIRVEQQALIAELAVH